MWKYVAPPLAVMTSAPFLVSCGMTILILGGLSGSGILELPKHRVSLSNSGLVQAANTFSTQDRKLVQEIQTLKEDTHTLLANEALNFLNFESNSNGTHERDPFAVIAPPVLSAEKIASDNLVQGLHPRALAKVMVPGESLTLKQTFRS